MIINIKMEKEEEEEDIMCTNFGMLTLESILVGLGRRRRRQVGKETRKNNAINNCSKKKTKNQCCSY